MNEAVDSCNILANGVEGQTIRRRVTMHAGLWWQRAWLCFDRSSWNVRRVPIVALLCVLAISVDVHNRPPRGVSG